MSETPAPRLADHIRPAWCYECGQMCAHERDVLNARGERMASFIACPCCEPQPPLPVTGQQRQP